MITKAFIPRVFLSSSVSSLSSWTGLAPVTSSSPAWVWLSAFLATHGQTSGKNTEPVTPSGQLSSTLQSSSIFTSFFFFSRRLIPSYLFSQLMPLLITGGWLQSSWRKKTGKTSWLLSSFSSSWVSPVFWNHPHSFFIFRHPMVWRICFSFHPTWKWTRLKF